MYVRASANTRILIKHSSEYAVPAKQCGHGRNEDQDPDQRKDGGFTGCPWCEAVNASRQLKLRCALCDFVDAQSDG